MNFINIWHRLLSVSFTQEIPTKSALFFQLKIGSQPVPSDCPRCPSPFSPVTSLSLYDFYSSFQFIIQIFRHPVWCFAGSPKTEY